MKKPKKKQNNGAVKSGTNEQSTQEQTTRNNIPSTSRITSNTTETLNTNKSLPSPPQIFSQDLISRAASMSATSALPIPSRTRKASNSSDDGDDPSSILGRTLPSTPPTMITFLDEGIDNGSNQHRLDEIAEEDEGTSSPSTNSSGQDQNNGTSSLHESSSSSASTSDNDDDLPIALLRTAESKQKESSRVKGKGVDRLRDENERENVS